MSRSQKARVALWLMVAVSGGLIGYVYTALSYPVGAADGAPPLRGMRAGLMIAAATSWLEIFAMRGAFGKWLKKMPLAQSFIVRVLAHSAIIAALLQLNVRIVSLYGLDLTGIYLLSDLTKDVVFSLAAMSIILFVIQMRQLVGPRTFRNLLSGRYHRPRREERIFAIFDIVGSSAVAKNLGDEAFHAYVSQVFFDIDAPIVDSGGEVMSFVGDALIADWPLGTPQDNRRAIRAAVAIMDLLARREAGYRERFGTSARMRAVLHGGAVVAGETGDSRRQITYLGDVLNIASRIEGIAKQTGTQIAISDSLLARCDLPEGVRADPVGGFPVKGGEQPVAISAIVRAAKTRIETLGESDRLRSRR